MEAGKVEAVANTFAQKLESKWLRIMVVVDDDDDAMQRDRRSFIEMR